MPTHFKSYVATFNRIRMSELIDFHAERARMQHLRPSLVVHPWTGAFYEPSRGEHNPVVGSASG